MEIYYKAKQQFCVGARALIKESGFHESKDNAKLTWGGCSSRQLELES